MIVPYTLDLDTLSIGTYDIVAIATDDRNGLASDTIHINVQDSPFFVLLHFQMFLNLSSIQILYRISSISIRDAIMGYTPFLDPEFLEGKEALQVDVSELGPGLYLVKTNYGVSKLRKE